MLAGSLCTALLRQVQLCNRVPPPSDWLPLIVDEQRVGAVLLSDVGTLKESDVFRIIGEKVEFAEGLETPEVRTSAVAELTASLREKGVVTGWRDELVAVAPAFGREPAFLVERAAYPLFGAKGYGVHVNGFTEDELWVARRSITKPTWPGLLDHIVAGHQPFGIAPKENVIKEAAEEAGIPEEIARQAIPVGAVSYCGLDEQERFKDDVLFCFDLELPSDFEPVAVDGEVDLFYKWPFDKVIDNILEGNFKPNVVLVIVDFLIRRGILTPEMPDYLALVKALRSGDCS